MNVFHTSRRVKSAAYAALALILIFTFMAGPGEAQPASQTFQSFIVQGTDADQAAALVLQYGGALTSRLDIIQGVGAILPEAASASLLAEPAILAVTPNAGVSVADKDSHGPKNPATDYPDVVGADVAWESGAIGSGVTVAVLDTGLANHQGVVKDVNGKKDKILAWVDFVDGRPNPQDKNGHGTHVAGVIANTEIGQDGEWNGVSPGVNLVIVRVLDHEGKGTYEQVIQGIQWAVDNKDEYNIRVLNLSLVSEVQSPYWADPFNQAVTRAWSEGILVVAAAGNTGPGPMSIGVPGNNPYVLTVGAYTDNYTPYDWDDDYLAVFSAAGPTLDGFVKPDVVAPGAHIVSTMLPGSELAREHPDYKIDSKYFSMAGTSQAAAVVSGIAAQVLSHNPGLTPDQVKYRIMYTAFPWLELDADLNAIDTLYSVWQQGAGRVNAPDAIFADIEGEANSGMDIFADLAGTEPEDHYEGFSYYDGNTGRFRLYGDTSESGFGVWSGNYEALTGGFGVWSGGFGVWSGGFGVWSGSYDVWSGGFGVWSGGFGVWSGGFGVWSGGFGVWSGGFGVWSGGEPWAGSIYSDPDFVSNFMAGVGPDTTSTITTLAEWVIEP